MTGTCTCAESNILVHRRERCFDGYSKFLHMVVHMMFEQTNLDAFRDAFCEQLKLKFKKTER